MNPFDQFSHTEHDQLDPFKTMGVLDHVGRKNIIGTIVGHPKDAPSRKEIKYYNPGISEATLSRHLVRLEECGLIDSASKQREGLNRGDSYRYYRLTEEARELFDQLNVFGPVPYKNLLEQVERSEEIRAAENAERPSF
ncbi:MULTISPECIES: helix-turn-helix transcriptional regulator [Haloferax]|uniref:ArsR family transcriptional regulator n=2 Tax=Haloferax TaxID=2251 RepID=A0A6G1Z7Y4_9EURY|nr:MULTISPECIES: helix-turn-helix transcriptional regulator [Haloferax]KAB1184793.1 helix-turn-helix transcriptional regulator [Haloferax sp. CBA1149]MRW82424.1 ArsR family transcriptional regulator [Haloferax marinisediminis]